MRVVHADNGERRGASPHRPGGISFVSLLKGSEGAPDNYELALLDIAPEYHAPRHRHNFDQVRIMLRGDFEWAPGQPQREGTIGYFCEGTYYTQRGLTQNRTLLLQCGGASGNGYMSARQLSEGVAALTTSGGQFHDGIYTWFDANGRKHNRDAYQAVWEHVHGRPMIYPRPRFQLPVIFDPQNVAGLVAGPGVTEKDMGRLNERGLAVKVTVLQPGAHATYGDPARKVLLYCASGGGSIAGQRFAADMAAELAAGETVTLQADAAAAIYVVALPEFSRQAEAGRPANAAQDAA